MTDYKRAGRKLKRAGGKLYKKRKDLKLSLEEISSKTKISKQYLKALESGDYSIFPADIFARGYFKQYAKFIGLEIPPPVKNNKNQETEIDVHINTNSNFVLGFSIFIFFALMVGITFLDINNDNLYYNGGNETHIQHIDQKNLMTLSIKFQEGSWLIINYDDDYETPIIDSYFTAGEEYELLFDAPISLTLDNAQSTTAFLNGLEIDLSENVNKYNSSTLVINDG